MTHFEDASVVFNYQYPPWPTPTSRPQSSLPSKDAVDDMFKLGIDNRNQCFRIQSSTASKRTIRHHVRIPTASHFASPPSLSLQSSSAPDVTVACNNSSTKSQPSRPVPVRIKPNALTIPKSLNKEEILYRNFPKQTYEKRKITNERKHKKQQAQTLVEKYADTETWFQLRRSLAELKRLATTQEILVDPTTSAFHCDGHSFTALKQVMAEQQDDKKTTMLKSESGTTFIHVVSRILVFEIVNDIIRL